MNSVQPIRDVSLIQDIAQYLKQKNTRDYILFLLGIYAPLRISDLLKLKVRDVRNKDYISMREKKTGKEQMMPINGQIKVAIRKYVATMEDYEFLFPSRQMRDGQYKAITRQRAYTIINEAAGLFGLYEIGCHTMRKTFGYHYYQQTKDIVKLQEIYNHQDPNTTKRYIGITQDVKDDAIKNFKYL